MEKKLPDDAINGFCIFFFLELKCFKTRTCNINNKKRHDFSGFVCVFLLLISTRDLKDVLCCCRKKQWFLTV